MVSWTINNMPHWNLDGTAATSMNTYIYRVPYLVVLVLGIAGNMPAGGQSM